MKQGVNFRLAIERAGSTVTLEAWDQKYKNNLDWNHAWGAAPANIIPRFVVGVQPARPGFAEVLIAPQPDRLDRFKAQVPTPHGPVSVELETDNDGGRRLRLHTPVPARLNLDGLRPATKRGKGGQPSQRLTVGRHEFRID